MPDSTSPTDLTRALADTLRAALEDLPQLVLDAEQVATRLAPGLSVRLAEAAEAAGVSPPALARALATRSEASGPGAGSVETRVLAALHRHASGRAPGVSPESLASLTGLSRLPEQVWLIVLPLPLMGLDGSPCRVIAAGR